MGIKEWKEDLEEAREKRAQYFALYCEGSFYAAKALLPFSQANREEYWDQYVFWRSKEEQLSVLPPWKILFYKRAQKWASSLFRVIKESSYEIG